MMDKLVIKEEKFGEMGLTVGQCYMEATDIYVEIFGSVTCTGKWDEDYMLKIKAALVDQEGRIKAISTDDDHICFIKTDYESFHIKMWPEKGRTFDHIELFPHLERQVYL